MRLAILEDPVASKNKRAESRVLHQPPPWRGSPPRASPPSRATLPRSDTELANDADIAGATEANYTLMSAEVGKTVKVRATFTDDRGAEETVLSDATAAVEAAVPPAIVAGGVQVTSAPQAASDTYGPGETITLTVTFDKAVTVDTTGGMPRIQFRLGPPRTDRWAEYSGGSGNTALTFTYEVQSGDMDSNGIWLPRNKLQLQSGTIRDAATNTADAILSYPQPGPIRGCARAILVAGKSRFIHERGRRLQRSKQRSALCVPSPCDDAGRERDTRHGRHDRFHGDT